MREKSKIKKEKYHNKVLEMKIIIIIINRQTFDKKNISDTKNYSVELDDIGQSKAKVVNLNLGALRMFVNFNFQWIRILNVKISV